MLHALVLTACRLAGSLLHQFGQLYALCHVAILNKLEHDIAFRGIRVETLITLFVVFLNQDDRILALSDIEIIGSAVHAQCIGFQTARDAPLRQRIGMDADEEVGLGLVGNVGTGMQGHKHIGLAGVDDSHVLTVTLHQPSKGQCHVQVDGLLLGQ